jgi:hypothetical protein
MAQVTNQSARTRRQQYVRNCILIVQDRQRAAKRESTGNPKARFSYLQAAAIIGKHLKRGASTVKIWASIDPRDIPDNELKKLQTLMRTSYDEQSSSRTD